MSEQKTTCNVNAEMLTRVFPPPIRPSQPPSTLETTFGRREVTAEAQHL